MIATSVPLLVRRVVETARPQKRRKAHLAAYAARVRARRLAKGWTVDQLTAASGLGRQTIVRAEATHLEPKAATLAALARALDTTMDALWHGDADTSAHNDKNE